MILDNFELINNFLRFKEDRSQFYLLQVIRRKKENPHTKSSYVIKSFYIRDNDHLLALKEEIVILCKTFNARAYINLNVKSYKKINYQLIKKLADNLTYGSEHGVVSALDSVCGETGSDADKYWLFDIDSKEESIIEEFKLTINNCRSGFDGKNVVLEVPTLNGVHLITHPFDLKQLTSSKFIFPVDVHKNTPTVIYYEGTTRNIESDTTK